MTFEPLMTSAEHYVEAEKNVVAAEGHDLSEDVEILTLLAIADMHLQLAQAAVDIRMGEFSPFTDDDEDIRP